MLKYNAAFCTTIAVQHRFHAHGEGRLGSTKICSAHESHLPIGGADAPILFSIQEGLPLEKCSSMMLHSAPLLQYSIASMHMVRIDLEANKKCSVHESHLPIGGADAPILFSIQGLPLEIVLKYDAAFCTTIAVQYRFHAHGEGRLGSTKRMFCP